MLQERSQQPEILFVFKTPFLHLSFFGEVFPPPAQVGLHLAFVAV